MKTKQLLLLVLFIFSLMAARDQVTAQEWSDEILLCPGTNPDFYINPSNGELNIVSIVDGKGVLYVRANKLGQVLDSVIVPNTKEEEGLLKFGPTVAVDNLNYAHIGFRIQKALNKYDIFYTRSTEGGWSTPLKISNAVERGYVVRMAIDGDNRVHFAHGSIDPDYPNITGPIHYFILMDGTKQFEQHNVDRIRGDERFELDVTASGIVDLVTSDLHYPPEGGPIYYWRSRAAGDSLTYRGDIHDDRAKNGANGSSDIFVDQSGKSHVCYGAEKDFSIEGKPSLRYCRLVNGIISLDTRVTDRGEIIPTEKVFFGIGSIAASEDGELVFAAYLTEQDGPLYTRFSNDGGRSWSIPQYQASGWSSAEARNKHILRAVRSDFYLVYPSIAGIKLRYLRLTPNDPPVANLATPDSAAEGATVNFDASLSNDPDGSIVAYHWDFQDDGIYDAITTLPTESYTFLDDFNGNAKVKVIDDAGDSSSVTVTVKIYNLPPTADAGGPYTATWYTPITLHGKATDPGINDIINYEWDIDADGLFESPGKDVPSLAYSAGDTHLVVLHVFDDDGGSDIDSALVIINNQAPIVSDIPDENIDEGESFPVINLDEFVNDPDNPDSVLIWEITGANFLNVNFDTLNRTVTLSLKEPTWVGLESLTFLVTDPGGKSDSDMASFSINSVNDPPVISYLPSQTRDENEPFANIVLDNYVTDPDDADSVLAWTFWGADDVTIQFIDRIVTIAVIDSEWAGIDTVGFSVADLAGLKDTAMVTFKINPINDPPVITQIQNQEIFQNQEFPPISLDDFVFDPDHADNQITWTWAGNSKLVLLLNENRILNIQRSDTAWTGTETIIFWAKDPLGLYDLFTTKFIVKTGVVGVGKSEKELIPTNFTLYPNYPNPFNPQTNIMYDVAVRSNVILKIYNQLGNEIRTLVDQDQAPGKYHLSWDGKDEHGKRVSSGVYFCRFQAGTTIQIQKMVLIY